MPAQTLYAPALLVIDVQCGAFDGERCAPVGAPDKLLRSVCRLLAAAREGGRPVFFLQQPGPPDSPFEAGSVHAMLHECLEPAAGEPVLARRGDDAFDGTGLAARLAALGVQELVLCGLQSELAVAATARAGLRLGQRVYLAHDGHSTWPADGQTPDAIVTRVNGELVAEGVRIASADGLAHGLRTPAQRAADAQSPAGG